ncbi:NGG1p interacting factor NIF3 [Saccharospirillum sp. MSK14-1]|uniref:NGG1p interacting factor NIF3 n=1 Tax=Saccharospirillum sp. MSK14-1 TaxID=1897632 RepID=UPI000D357D0B|nr:NGG1p interacting factor NIF3 [Saccharospirillum sp. MSK14-1]PTY36295.1 NGG1p interacting factor NIF3 [Saccharospirillum sp. MSK14-1]
MHLLAVYVPESHKDSLIEALAQAGAGRIGDYEACAWSTLGQGQFRPLDGARPHLGQVGELEEVAEYKIEMVCEDSVIPAVLATLVLAHPYEEPAHHLLPILSRRDFQQ